MRAAQEPSSSTSWGSQQQTPTTEQEPLTKRQCKHRRAKYTKSAKKFTNLNSQINTLKLQIEALNEKISHASKTAHSGFKRKKIRTMKREANKLTTQLAESERRIESMRVPNDPVSGAPLKQHPPSSPKCIEVKIAERTKQKDM